jgi:hypothetical protein
MKVRLHAEAEAEVAEAFLYFEREREGLGMEFVRAVHEAINRIIAGPECWPVIRGDARRCLTHKFKYGVVYRTRPEEIQVLAVGDLRRKPYYWWKRRQT